MTPATEPPLLPVEPAFRHVLRAQLAITWMPVAIGAVVADQMLLRATPFHGLASIVVPLLAVMAIALIPQRRYSRLRYRLTDRMLQSLHGWMFHTDTIVPFVRVQHRPHRRHP